ncbi:MAG TPA: ATP-binding protein [Burkholderiales bacterium]|nr:ATP-binding protein [Burkholderiales bacterium]
MKLYYPKSFLQLILLGFVLVSVPLVFAFFNAALYVDRLANQSQKAVYQAVQVTQGNRILVEQLTQLERTVRQFIILGDQSLLEGYAKTHQNFRETAFELARLPLDEAQKKALDELVEREQKLYAGLQKNPQDPGTSKSMALEYVLLSDLAQSILAQSNLLIDREVDVLQQTAAQAQRILLWQVLASIPIAILLAVGFTILIARPIHQLDNAIRQLGGEHFSSTIEVKGPQDLENLGQRLDWLRQRLIELEQQKTRFLRHVSHELKTPLTAIREGSELLNDEVAGKLSGEQREITSILRQNSLQLQKLIEDLLSYHTSKFRNTALDLKAVDLKNIVDKVAEDQKLALVSKNLQLQTICCETTFLGDQEKLRVIVDNLLSNAIKYSPQGGTIQINLERDDKMLQLDVIDGGLGIAEEDKSRVFDEFYQGRPAANSAVKGSGLGLAIAREHVVAHGGNIEIMDSNASGAHFRVTLPCRRAGE